MNQAIQVLREWAAVVYGCHLFRHRDPLWSEVQGGLTAIARVIAWLFCAVTFPVTGPLVVWLWIWEERRLRRRHAQRVENRRPSR